MLKSLTKTAGLKKRSNLLFLFFALLFLSLSDATANAQEVTNSFTVFKNRYAVQTSTAAPTISGYVFGANTSFLQTPLFIEGTSLTYANSQGQQTINLIPFPTVRYTSPTYSSATQLDSLFPATEYTLHVAGRDFTNTPTVISGSLALPANTFPEAIPYLTGDTYSRLQVIDPTKDFALAWSGFTPANGYTGTINYFFQEVMGGQVLIGDPFSSSITSAILPANTLQVDKNYIMYLYYSNEQFTPDLGFDNATGITRFTYRTAINFSTVSVVVPEPGALSLLLLPLGITIFALSRQTS